MTILSFMSIFEVLHESLKFSQWHVYGYILISVMSWQTQTILCFMLIIQVFHDSVYSYIIIFLSWFSPLTIRCLAAIYPGPPRHYIALLSRSCIWLLLSLFVLDITVLGAGLSRSSTIVGSSISFVSGSRKKRKDITKQRLPKAAPGPQGTYRA